MWFCFVFLCNRERKHHKLGKIENYLCITALKRGQRASMKDGVCARSFSRSPFMSLITAMKWGDPSVKPPADQIYTLQACSNQSGHFTRERVDDLCMSGRRARAASVLTRGGRDVNWDLESFSCCCKSCGESRPPLLCCKVRPNVFH